MRLSRIVLYVVGVAGMFVLAAGVDRVAGPLFAPAMQTHDTDPTASADMPSMAAMPSMPSMPPMPSARSTTNATTGMSGHGDHKLTPERGLPWIPGGLQIAQDGYALQVLDAPSRAGRNGKLRFRITGPDGRPVTAYTPTHEKLLHLIVVRRDLAHYQHLHPALAADGTWSTWLGLAEPGTYRLIADCLPRGRDEQLILGADLLIPGSQQPAARQTDTRTSNVGGYTVSLQGKPSPGSLSRLTFTFARNGAPVTDLEPYLGAYGHLVAIRNGDLAYLHVHPTSTASGPTISFDAEVPSGGTYRLYLDFRYNGVVRTAEFTVTTEP